jgi:Uma2 family endonuclease
VATVSVTMRDLLLDAEDRMELTERGLVEKVAHPAHGNMDHRISARLIRLGTPDECVFKNTRLSPDRDGLRYVPDTLVVLPENPVPVEPHADYAGVPDLVVEILSEGRADRERDEEEKVRRYAIRGVPHYWIADPDTGTTVRWLRLRPETGAYETVWTRPLGEAVMPWSAPAAPPATA